MSDAPERDTRPSPDALLKQVEQENRGRLKVFLGAAPGVGKTYEMLMQGRKKRLEGVDVVIGVVETHGRVETEMLTKGFEVVPKKRSLYKGRVLAEMDLDAILLRKPALVLVDELAHTNVPGSRHPKRYQDVREVLDAGIDVYSTLNVQHLESLNDVVARITHVVVRETVPDLILDSADDVELVDLTPEDLIQRLKEGKVYLPQQAERAIRNYFMPGNLTALRELALRRTARRVDEQMVDYMRAHAIQGPWEAGDRILVCIDGRPGSAGLVRYARRMADRIGGSWIAITVETSQTRAAPEGERDRIAEAMRLTERLGGQAVTVPAASFADGVIDYAHANNFTHIIVSSAHRPSWMEFFGSSPTQEIIRRAGDISVHVVPMTTVAESHAGKTSWTWKPSHLITRALDVGAYGGSAMMAGIAVVVGEFLKRYLATSNVALVFLTAVLVSAVRYGLWPALFTALVSVLAYNFFFLPPLYTFTIADPENVVALFFFFLIAVIASNLAGRVREQALAASERASATEDLYLFSRKLAGVVSLDDLLWASAHQIAQMLKLRVVILLPESGTLEVRVGYPPEDTLDDASIAAAKWCWQHGEPAGRGADTLPGAQRLFLPMKTARGTVGVIGLDKDEPGPMLTPDGRRLLDALSDQAALAIERINLVADVDKTRLAAETERLRNALLTSISHDLRTPLASILGSATALRSYRRSLGNDDLDGLTATIQDEAERLNRFIGNLLDMTRLESGSIQPHADAVDVADVVGSAVDRASKVLAGHLVELDIAQSLPMAKGDPVLLEQVLFNLLDNAAKYTPAGTRVTVSAQQSEKQVLLKVTDEGNGIPGADLERIFDKFYRVRAGDKKLAGTGLGLAICRGFVEAMGGTIAATNRSDRSGALFTIALPFVTQASNTESAS